MGTSIRRAPFSLQDCVGKCSYLPHRSTGHEAETHSTLCINGPSLISSCCRHASSGAWSSDSVSFWGPMSKSEVVFEVQPCRLLSEQNTWIRLADHGGAVGELVFSPRGRFVAVAVISGQVAIWDTLSLPHLALLIDPPSAGDIVKSAGEDAEYVVAGMTWFRHTASLLVTYHVPVRDLSVICRWDLETGSVLRHRIIRRVGGTADVCYRREEDCVVYSGRDMPMLELDLEAGTTVRLDTTAFSQEMFGRHASADVSSEVTTSPVDITREATTGAGGAGGTPVVRKDRPGQGSQQRLCMLSVSSGACVYCVIDRVICKLDPVTMKAVARSEPKCFTATAVVLKLSIDKKETLLLASTSRGAYIFEPNTLTLLTVLGDFKVEWAGWTLGFDCSNPEDQRLVVVGAPQPSTYDQHHERIFIWALTEGGFKGPVFGSGPDDGLIGLQFHPRRAVIYGVSPKGSMYCLQECFSTSFPGPMYCPGYTVLESNLPYVEREDELDRTVLSLRGEGGGRCEGLGNEARQVACPFDEDVDVEGSGAFDLVQRGSDFEDAEARIPVAMIISPIASNETVRADELVVETEVEEGGLRDVYPMPLQLLRRLKGGSKAAGTTQDAAIGKDRIRGRLSGELQRLSTSIAPQAMQAPATFAVTQVSTSNQSVQYSNRTAV